MDARETVDLESFGLRDMSIHVLFYLDLKSLSTLLVLNSSMGKNWPKAKEITDIQKLKIAEIHNKLAEFFASLETSNNKFNEIIKIITKAAEANDLKFLWETKNRRPDAFSDFNRQLADFILKTEWTETYRGMLERNRGALENICLIKSDLMFTDLRGANLRNANLQGSYGREVIFMNANMYDADLQQTSFRNANFINADLQKVNFQGADLTGALLSKTLLRGATFSSEQLLSANSVAACMVDTATFIKNNFSESDLKKFQDKMKSEYLDLIKKFDAIKEIANYLLMYIVPNKKIDALRQEELVLNITSLAAGISIDWTDHTGKVVEAAANRIAVLLEKDSEQKKSVTEDISLREDLEFINSGLNDYHTKTNNARFVTYYTGLWASTSTLSSELKKLPKIQSESTTSNRFNKGLK